MKLREDFVLRQVADTWVVLPIGKATVEFNGMLTLNETGVVLWQAIQNGVDPIKAIITEYDIPYEKAAIDVEEFVNSLRTVGCLED